MWLIINGELVLYGSVGASPWDDSGFTASDVIEALVMMSGDITVRLNSGGGYPTEAIAIYNALKAYPGKVTIVVDSIACSAASLIAMAGDTIVMAPASLMMIHDPSQDVYGGTADDMQSSADFLNLLADQCAAIYAAKAGITPAEARVIMKAETWYDAAAAVAAGFADEVQAIALPATAKAGRPALFDYRLYAHAPEMLMSLATTSASLFTPKSQAAPAAQPQETSMTLAELIALLAARFKTPAADVTTMCNQAIAAGIELASLTLLLKPDAVATMAAARDAVKAKAVELLGVTHMEPIQLANANDAQMTAADVRDVMSRGAKAGLDATAIMAIMAAHPTKDAAMNAIIDKVAETNGTRAAPGATAHVTEDATDKFREGASRALMMKIGLEKGERNEFSGLNLVELARESLRVSNVPNITKMDRMVMIGHAFTHSPRMASGMISTSDFAYILQNVASKSALKGYQEQDETFQLWTSTGQVSDFKAVTRVDLGLFPILKKVAEGAEFKYAAFSDRGVSIAVSTYGLLVAITRQAIINDDLNMLDKLPQKMGRGAKRTLGNLAYGLLTANAALADNVALFHATHGNLAGAGAAPSEATWQAAVIAMQKQQDADKNAVALNIVPKYFLSGAYQFTAKQLLQSTGSIDNTKTAGVINTVQGLVTSITDQRITGNQWFMAADPNQVDTIEMTYLDGVQEPTLETQEGWRVDGTELKVRLDAAATVLDFRGLYKNAGP